MALSGKSNKIKEQAGVNQSTFRQRRQHWQLKKNNKTNQVGGNVKKEITKKGKKK